MQSSDLPEKQRSKNGNNTGSPKLREYLDKLYTLKKKIHACNKPMCAIRQDFIGKLQSLENRTPTETKLLSELLVAADEQAAEKSKLETLVKDKQSLYEKIRQVCRDMFLGKYIFRKDSSSRTYYRVLQVKISANKPHSVLLVCDRIYLPDTFNLPVIDHGIKVTILTCDTDIEPSCQTLYNYMYFTREDILSDLTEKKDNMMALYDSFMKAVENMESCPLPADTPCEPEKWW